MNFSVRYNNIHLINGSAEIVIHWLVQFFPCPILQCFIALTCSDYGPNGSNRKTYQIKLHVQICHHKEFPRAHSTIVCKCACPWPRFAVAAPVMLPVSVGRSVGSVLQSASGVCTLQNSHSLLTSAVWNVTTNGPALQSQCPQCQCPAAPFDHLLCVYRLGPYLKVFVSC